MAETRSRDFRVHSPEDLQPPYLYSPANKKTSGLYERQKAAYQETERARFLELTNTALYTIQSHLRMELGTEEELDAILAQLDGEELFYFHSVINGRAVATRETLTELVAKNSYGKICRMGSIEVIPTRGQRLRNGLMQRMFDTLSGSYEAKRFPFTVTGDTLHYILRLEQIIKEFPPAPSLASEITAVGLHDFVRLLELLSELPAKAQPVFLADTTHEKMMKIASERLGFHLVAAYNDTEESKRHPMVYSTLAEAVQNIPKYRRLAALADRFVRTPNSSDADPLAAARRKIIRHAITSHAYIAHTNKVHQSNNS